MLKKFLGILSFIVVFSSCNNNDEPIIPKEEIAPLTVLVYFVADNNLEEDLANNIQSMYLGLQSIKDYRAELLIYWDGTSNDSINFKIEEKDESFFFKTRNYWKNPTILKYSSDGNGRINGEALIKPEKNKKKALQEFYENVFKHAEIIKEYNTQVSTNPNVMRNVLTDMVSNVHTNKIGLIAGSHATSWISKPSSSRAFGDDNGDWIQISDMATTLSEINRTFDFLLFDACLMGSIEVCYDFRNVTNYQIVSVLEIPAYGFPYDNMIQYLFEGSADGYKKACKAYLDFYTQRVKDKISNSWGTISLLNSKMIESYTEIIRNQILINKDKLSNFSFNGIQEYGKVFPYISIDSRNFIKKINEGIVPNEYIESLDKLIVYTGALDKTSSNADNYKIDLDNYCGLGMYVPIKNKYEWNTYFKTIDWFTASGWNAVDFSWNF